MPPLAGVRVVDLSQMWAGPGTGMYLADQGADVIKVEPLWGDDGRRAFTQRPVAGDESRAFLALNRSKRGIAVDIRHPDGREVIRRLVQDVDVLLHNFRPGVAERLGYDYPTLRALNGRLIYAWITAFGAEGPLAALPGYDFLLQARSGIMARRRLPDGTPIPAPVWVADASAPMALAYGITLALLMRERTGRGQVVTTSLMQAALAMQMPDLVQVEHEADGGADPVDYTSQAMWAPYRCGDGRYLVIAVLQDEQWQRLCRVLERPDLAADSGLARGIDRARQSEGLLRPLLAEAFKARARDDWIEALAAGDVPAAPLVDADEVFSDPQVLANRMLVDNVHPMAGRTVMVRPPVRLHEIEASEARPAPGLGEHTEEVLRAFGYSPAAIQALEAAGVIRRFVAGAQPAKP